MTALCDPAWRFGGRCGASVDHRAARIRRGVGALVLAVVAGGSLTAVGSRPLESGRVQHQAGSATPGWRLVECAQSRDQHSLALVWNLIEAGPIRASRLIVVDVGSPKPAVKLDAREAALVSAAVSDDGRVLVGGLQILQLWSAGSRTKLWDRGERGAVYSSVLMVAGKPAAAVVRQLTGARGGVLDLRSLQTGNLLRTLGTTAPGSVALAGSGDGRMIAAGLPDAPRVWRTDRAAPPRALPAGRAASVAFSPDARFVAVGYDRAVAVCRADTGATAWTARLPGSGFALSLAFSPDGTRLASGHQDSSVRLWDPGSGRRLAVLRGHRAGVHFVGFLRGSAELLSAGWDDTVKLWDVGRARLAIPNVLSRIPGARPTGTQ
jgi:WD40 repeat protein